MINTKNGASCQTECRQNKDCKFWSYDKDTKSCYLLKEAKEPTSSICNPDKCKLGLKECNCKRGPKECPADPDDNGGESEKTQEEGAGA